MYQQQINKFLGWNHIRSDDESVSLLNAALRNGPTEAMTPADLEAHVQEQLTDFHARQRVVEQEETDDWRAAQTEPVSDEDAEAHRQRLQERHDGWIEGSVATAIIAETDPPYVVIADTNWGDHDSVSQFAIGPDPRTGELRIFTVDAISGELHLKDDNWDNARWQTSE